MFNVIEFTLFMWPVRLYNKLNKKINKNYLEEEWALVLGLWAG